MNPWAVVGGLVISGLLGVRWRRVATFLLLFAAAIVVSLRSAASRDADLRALAALDSSRFVVVETPLDRDWSPRGPSFALRATSFRIGARRFDRELIVYARFEPPPLGMQARLRGEGFVTVNERGEPVLTIKSPRLLAYEGTLPWYAPAAWNRRLALRLRPYVPAHRTEVVLIEALVLGRGERLTDEIRDDFRQGGTYHLLVFSGMQIALAAAALALLLRWLHRTRAADWLLLAFALLAPLFIGPTASVLRASIGIGLIAVARLAKRPTSLENLWCVAAIVRLLTAPGDLTDAGFQLTYAGAGALLFIGKRWGRGRWLAYVLAAELAVTPLTLFHFHRYAVGGSLTTIAMTPLVSAMLVVGAVTCAFPCTPLFALLALLHRACMMLNGVSACAAGVSAAPPVASLLLTAALALLAVAFLRGRWRAVAIALALLIPLVASVPRANEGDRVTFLDVGQGDAILLRSDGHAILVDGGYGESLLLPLLADRGIRSLDLVVLTHPHPDHCGGLPAVLRNLAVKELWVSPRRFRGDCAESIYATAPPLHLVRDGERRTIGALHVRAFVPGTTFKHSPENNASVVLLVTAQRRRILLTGDVEREAETLLSDRDIHADVLKVAHHGSRSSTTRPLLDAVRPRLAFISCGRHNLFGHPHAAVLEALAERGVRVWRTDRDGSVELEIRGGRLFVRSADGLQ